MLESFVDWLLNDLVDWLLNDLIEIVGIAVKKAAIFIFVVITAPIWAILYVLWFFIEWRKGPEVEKEPDVEAAKGSSHTGEPERESAMLNTFLGGSYE